MRSELDLAVANYRKAVSRLQEVTKVQRDDITRDALIQRFEFTFELLWKTFRLLLRELKGVEAHFPKECLKAGFQAGWIRDEPMFSRMLEDRNAMSHRYDEADSKAIAGRILEAYALELARVADTLEAALKEG